MAFMNCTLPDCGPTAGQCGGEINKPIVGALFAPYVSMTLGNEITVGNNSSPLNNHHAVIKSMEYGASDGNSLKVEIVDEEGGAFKTFVEKLNKKMCEGTNDYKLVIDFGWIIESCNGDRQMKTISNIPSGGPLTFLPLSCDAIYEGGKIKFTITALDLLHRVFENRNEKPIGTENHKEKLTDAIIEIFRRTCPRIERIRFLRRTNGPMPTDWHFRNSDQGPRGPASVWPGDQQSVIDTVRKWINNLTTDWKKGATFGWDCGSPVPTLIIWEGQLPEPDQNFNPCNRSLGTYIVNGGDCSPVISFNPKVEWIMSSYGNSGGNSFGSAGQKTAKAQGDGTEPPTTKDGGTQLQTTVAQNSFSWRAPDLTAEKIEEAISKHERAARPIELKGPIEAELRIQGDPRFVHPLLWTGKYISIIVVNPYHIFGTATGCEWVALPPCNSIYSDDSYMIKGVNHIIKEGSYTTTLKVFIVKQQKTDGR